MEYKFKLGDKVKHIASANFEQRMLIIGRGHIEYSSGIQNTYFLSWVHMGSAVRGWLAEEELELLKN